MSVPLLPLFGAGNNPGPDNWVDALNQLINYLNTNFYYNPGGSSGGSFISSQQTIISGSTATAVFGQITFFNSASGLPKTLTPPTATGSFGVVAAMDQFNDGWTNNITLNAPVILNQNSVYTNGSSALWLDVGNNLWTKLIGN